MIGPKEIAAGLLGRGTEVLSRAARLMMKDQRAQEWVARAVGAAQRGKQRLDEAEEQLLHAVGLPARPDYEEVAKRMARLKRQLRELSRKLDEKERPR